MNWVHLTIASQSANDIDFCDMELTNCETNVHGSLQDSFSLCSPESLLKPLRSSELTMNSTCVSAVLCQALVPYESSGIHTSEKSFNIVKDIACEDNAAAEAICDAQSNKIEPSSTRAADINCSHSDESFSHTTCEEDTLPQTNSCVCSTENSDVQLPLSCATEVVHTLTSKTQDRFNLRELNSTLETSMKTHELEVVPCTCHHTSVNPPSLPMMKQMQSKLLLVSPYLEAHTSGGGIHPATSECCVRCITADGDTSIHESGCIKSLCKVDNQLTKDQSCEYVPFHHNKTANSYAEVGLSHHARSEFCSALGESMFPKVSGVDTECNWLQNSGNNSIHLGRTLELHVNSVDQSNCELSRTMTCAQSLTSSVPPFLQIEDSPLQKAVSSAKATTEQTDDKKLEIESPEVLPIQKRTKGSPYVSSNSLSFLEDLTTYQQGSGGQSVMMSPSVFSKFLATLKCDRSILCVGHPHMVDGQSSPSEVCQLRLSQANTHTTRSGEKQMFTQIHGYDCARRQSTTGPLSTFLEMLQER